MRMRSIIAGGVLALALTHQLSAQPSRNRHTESTTPQNIAKTGLDLGVQTVRSSKAAKTAESRAAAGARHGARELDAVGERQVAKGFKHLKGLRRLLLTPVWMLGLVGAKTYRKRRES